MRKAIMDSTRVFCETFDPPQPVVEIGSFYPAGYGERSDLRPVFAPREFIGCDVREGPGVDRLEDAQALGFPDGAVGTILMFELLEHLPRPHQAVAEARRVLAPDGLLVLSVPFDFRLHAFPIDYWRFTASGIALLLSEFEDCVIFALGPRVKPGFIFAVAAKTASEQFVARKPLFRERIHELQRRTRRRGFKSVLGHRSREFLGLLTGRADLSVQFLEGSVELEYPTPPGHLVGGPSAR
jgi:SAM-dependent methyltransferase